MSHWAVELIGIPWRAGEHDCWAFVRCVQRERFGRDLPAVDVDALNALACARAIKAHDERTRWRRVTSPREGDLVLLAHAKYPTHVGVWVEADGGGVLHCLEGDGVVFQGLLALRLSGWAHLEYYRARG